MSVRTVKLFRNGHNQAVRIPVAFELPGAEAVLRREGNKLIIEPIDKLGLLTVLAGWSPTEEEPLLSIEDRPVEPEDIF